MRNYQEFLARKRREYGEKFDPSDLAPQFVKFYESEQRIEVSPSWNERPRRGRIGVTTGWKPVFLLMHRRSNSGSWDTLSVKDTVVKVVA